MPKRRKATAAPEPTPDGDVTGSATPAEPTRNVRGQFLPGRPPPVGHPPWPKGYCPSPGGKPTSVVGRMKAIAKAEPARVEEAARLPFRLIEDETQDGATRLGALKVVMDRIDGPVALKIEGLSEAQMRAWLLRAIEALQRRLPPEYHQAIAEALWEATGEELPRDVEAELPPAP